MNATEFFIKRIEEVYGMYNSSQRQLVTNWLKDKSDRFIATLFTVVTESISAMYKTPPGIPEFKKSESEVLDRIESMIMRENAKKVISDNRRLLSDPGPGTIEINGEMINAADYFFEILGKALSQNRNPKTDPEVIKAYELVTGEKL